MFTCDSELWHLMPRGRPPQRIVDAGCPNQTFPKSAGGTTVSGHTKPNNVSIIPHRRCGLRFWLSAGGKVNAQKGSAAALNYLSYARPNDCRRLGAYDAAANSLDSNYRYLCNQSTGIGGHRLLCSNACRFIPELDRHLENPWT